MNDLPGHQIDLMLGGDKRVLHRFLRHYWITVENVIAKRLRNVSAFHTTVSLQEIKGDIIQDFWEKALMNGMDMLRRYDPDRATMQVYLRGKAWYFSLTRYNRAYRPRDGTLPLDGKIAEVVLDAVGDPERRVVARALLRRVAALIASTLSLRQRQVFEAKRIDGLKYKEIAQKYGITEAAAQKAYGRARDKVADLCRELDALIESESTAESESESESDGAPPPLKGTFR